MTQELVSFNFKADVSKWLGHLLFKGQLPLNLKIIKHWSPNMCPEQQMEHWFKRTLFLLSIVCYQQHYHKLYATYF